MWLNISPSFRDSSGEGHLGIVNDAPPLHPKYGQDLDYYSFFSNTEYKNDRISAAVLHNKGFYNLGLGSHILAVVSLMEINLLQIS